MSASKFKIFHTRDRVFAKVRGYPAWPARVERVVEGPAKSSRYHVFFYGTHETAVCKPDDLYDYESNKIRFGGSQKRKHFNEALWEIDNVPNIQSATIEDGSLKEVLPTKEPNSSAAQKKGEIDSDSLIIDDVPGEEIIEVLDVTKTVQSRKRKREDRQSEEGQVSKRRATARQRRESRDSKDSASVKSESLETPVTDVPRTSRSGRKIKPKRFADDEESPRSGSIRSKEASEFSPGGSQPNGAPTTPVSETLTKTKHRVALTMTEITLRESSEEKQITSCETPEAITSPLQHQAAQSSFCASSGEPVSGRNPVSPASVESPVKHVSAEVSHSGMELTGGHVSEKRKMSDTIGTPGQVSESVKEETAGDVSDEDEHNDAEESEEQGEESMVVDEVPTVQKNRTVSLPLDYFKKERKAEKKRNKLRWLQVEAKMVQINSSVKRCLNIQEADSEECLKLMDEFMNLVIAPLMLKKHPNVADTIRKLRCYVGNVREWQMTPEKQREFESNAEKIRQKAESLYLHFKSLFSVPQGKAFWHTFCSHVEKFQSATAKMKELDIMRMTRDPECSDCVCVGWHESDSESEGETKRVTEETRSQQKSTLTTKSRKNNYVEKTNGTGELELESISAPSGILGENLVPQITSESTISMQQTKKTPNQNKKGRTLAKRSNNL